MLVNESLHHQYEENMYSAFYHLKYYFCLIIIIIIIIIIIHDCNVTPHFQIGAF